MAKKKAAKKKAKRVVPQHTLFRQHKGHSKHLCSLVRDRRMHLVADLATNAKYICHICGRSAKKAENLCEPVEM